MMGTTCESKQKLNNDNGASPNSLDSIESHESVSKSIKVDVVVVVVDIAVVVVVVVIVIFVVVVVVVVGGRRRQTKGAEPGWRQNSYLLRHVGISL